MQKGKRILYFAMAIVILAIMLPFSSIADMDFSSGLIHADAAEMIGNGNSEETLTMDALLAAPPISSDENIKITTIESPALSKLDQTFQIDSSCIIENENIHLTFFTYYDTDHNRSLAYIQNDTIYLITIEDILSKISISSENQSFKVLKIYVFDNAFYFTLIDSKQNIYFIKTADFQEYILLGVAGAKVFSAYYFNETGPDIYNVGEKFVISCSSVIFRNFEPLKNIEVGAKMLLGYTTTDFQSFQELYITADEQFIKETTDLTAIYPETNDPSWAMLDLYVEKELKNDGLLIKAHIISGLAYYAEIHGEIYKTLYYRLERDLETLTLITASKNTDYCDVDITTLMDIQRLYAEHQEPYRYTHGTIIAYAKNVPIFDQKYYGSGLGYTMFEKDETEYRYLFLNNFQHTPTDFELYKSVNAEPAIKEFTLSNVDLSNIFAVASRNYAYRCFTNGVLAISPEDKSSKYAYIHIPDLTICGAVETEHGLIIQDDKYNLYYLPDDIFIFPTITKTPTDQPISAALTPAANADVKVNEASRLAAIPAGMTAEELSAMLENDSFILLGADGNELDASELVGTGSKIQLTDTDGNILFDYDICVPLDNNGDGRVNSADARAALRSAAKLALLDGVYARASDYNGDGRVNSADARFILRVAARLDRVTDALIARMVGVA